MKLLLPRLCLVLVSLSTFAFSAVTWTTIDYPGALLTQACGINSAGDIVGIFNTGSGTQSFFLSGGVFTTIQYPDANSTTFAYGINDNGDVVGTYVDPGGFRGGFLKQGSTFTQINFPGSSSTIAWGVNNSDAIVGEYVGADALTHGFTWNAGTFITTDITGAVLTSLKGINNLGDIAGEFLLSNGAARGVVISNAQTHRFVAPGSTGDTLGWGINDSRQVVGWTDLSGKEVGFVLFNNNFTFISAPGRTITHAFGINSAGDIVGYYQGMDGIEHGFLRSR
jgi:uncharacterized membrane protein